MTARPVMRLLPQSETFRRAVLASFKSGAITRDSALHQLTTVLRITARAAQEMIDA